jgi:predicted metal-binding membrane protein
MTDASGGARPGPALPLAVPLAIGGAWAAAVLATASGRAGLLHHDALLDHGPPFWVAVALFLLSWLAMIVAMMLPSSLPMVRHYAFVTQRQGRPGDVRRFLAGYGFVWLAFGYVAFGADLGLHHVADRTTWINAHPWVVAGSVLVGAGAFQFTALKERCLTNCRHPAAYLMHQRLRGIHDPLRLGIGHGLDCLGCCWALMLVMFAAGVANLAWMAGLSGVMLYEKVAPHGRRLTPIVGLALLVWGTTMILHAPWLPNALAGVR